MGDGERQDKARATRLDRRRLLLRERDAYGTVLVLLVIVYVLAIVAETRVGIAVQMGLVTATLLVAFYTSGVRTARLVIVGCVSAACFALVIVLIWFQSPFLRGVASGLMGLLVLGAPVAILRRIFGHERVSGNTILGALCVYVLLGVMFAFAYQTVAAFATGPFFQAAGEASRSDYMYFSFVTLTTVGYGDLVPIGDVGRSLAITEALMGQIFLVTLIGRLVALYGWTRSVAVDVPSDGPSTEPDGSRVGDGLE